VAYGGERAEDLLRQALAMGANRAVLVAEPALEMADAFGLTAVLKQVMASHAMGGADLVLLGAEVLDADLAQVGPRLAQALGWPFVEGVYQVRAQAGGTLELVVAGGATLRAGAYRAVQANQPAVASVVRDSNRPRFAPAAQIIRAYTTPQAVERLALSDLDLTGAGIAPLTRRRGDSFPAERTLGAVLDGADDQNVGKVVEALRQR
jgi:electron transfer flavoprotein beta subunit